MTARPVLRVVLLYACDQECTNAKRLDDRTPEFCTVKPNIFNIITALFSLTYQNVYQFTRIEQREPENGEVEVTPELW
jgi:hypothetical protein